jgi:hypothetical protein
MTSPDDVLEVIERAKFGYVSAYEVERVFRDYLAGLRGPEPEKPIKTKWKTFGGPLFLILVEK